MKFVFVTFYEICYLNDTSSSWVLAGSHFKKTPESLASIWFNQIFDLGPLQQIQCHYAISGFLKIWVGWSWKTTKKEKYITIKKTFPHYQKWIFWSGSNVATMNLSEQIRDLILVRFAYLYPIHYHLFWSSLEYLYNHTCIPIQMTVILFSLIKSNYIVSLFLWRRFYL